jgi:hypothetical protein
MSLEVDQLIADCQVALAEDRPQQAVREVLERAVRTTGQYELALAFPRQQMTVLHVSEELTMFQLVNAPGFVFPPHTTGRGAQWRSTPGGNATPSTVASPAGSESPAVVTTRPKRLP